ncbi:NUC189-domain-containing protein [Dothidotthia symphoricarpi CBS 119687]|uniref:NUC189-domain-containing protein n=1 Tax=Dothidotthia symphoricarpi CBS 119687 TaxID=1392245 RepID=A0A6A6AG07_9PLEO|nr:NUC189-domain-containing protein [Dothidotthia symphoricarpi CBS 119687]KAF2130720.1 NUC189-domain-containing protein [Dothidotthia symphoricarpi CBS 119687]
MPAAVASRARDQKPSKATRDSAPPAKKTKLAQSPATIRQNGLKALLNGGAAQKPTAKLNGAKPARHDRVDEATAVVGGGQSGHGDVDMKDAAKEVIEISSAEEEESDVSESEDEPEEDVDETAPAVNGHGDAEDRLMDDETVDPEDLSFGDRLRASEPEPVRESRIVDVESAFVGANAESRALATAANSRPLSAPSASSLGTVLTQALRTNDQELLESCLRVIDVDTIYATVERLPSPLVGTLLQKLAERLHKKPGRAGMLMVWVQWSLAAHGGYLASQPQLVKQLTTLNKVLKERASGLQPLLSLKGRLDMLQAQLELRRRNQKAANDDEDEAVIYVEGEDDYVSSVEGDDEDAAAGSRKRIRQDFEDDDESSVDEMPTTMEVDEDSEEGSEDSDGLIDDEAEETDDDVGDDISEPMSDDLDDGEGVSESEEEPKPARRSTAGRAGLKSRR